MVMIRLRCRVIVIARSQQQDGYTCDSTDSFGWTGLPSHPSTSASVSTNHELQVYDLSKSKEYTTDLSGPGDIVIEGSQAWDLWSEGKAMEMVDPSIRDSCNEIEVLRCIQLGMLCVQDSALHRPNMASVVLMLESSTTSVPLPRQPTFTSVRASIDTETLMEAQEIASSNDLTVTMVAGR
ncbi:hypothetical protein DKX38_016969 [Salix brachista]|uniref:S-locus receptor kinase C-terminal domain-containing protein n=1 Tax=Salix brachista TaxID=2182728 RepID=A0A5N5KTY3_9ROSI|nr:hypothetical protein DKX38_016969 [Salix brachista]